VILAGHPPPLSEAYGLKGKEPGKAIANGWGQSARVWLVWSFPRKYQNVLTSSGSTQV
jgi:hypothetical protein